MSGAVSFLLLALPAASSTGLECVRNSLYNCWREEGKFSFSQGVIWLFIYFLGTTNSTWPILMEIYTFKFLLAKPFVNFSPQQAVVVYKVVLEVSLNILHRTKWCPFPVKYWKLFAEEWQRTAISVSPLCNKQEGTLHFYKIPGPLWQRMPNETILTRNSVSVNALLCSGFLVS